MLFVLLCADSHVAHVTSGSEEKDVATHVQIQICNENADVAKIDTNTIEAEQADNGDMLSNSDSVQQLVSIATGPKGRRTKAQMKQELRERKVQEKQRELRRVRTRNRKYMSDDFTSIFTENKVILSSSGYADDDKKEIVSGSDYVQEEVVETVIAQSIEIAECVEVGSSSSSEASGDSRPGSPYSEISNSTVYSISSDSEDKSSSDEAPVEKPDTKKDNKSSRSIAKDTSPEYLKPSAKRRRVSTPPLPRRNSSNEKLQRYSPHNNSPSHSRHESPLIPRPPRQDVARDRLKDDSVRTSTKRRDDTSNRKAGNQRDVSPREDSSRRANVPSDYPRSGGVRMRQVGGSRRNYYYYDSPKVADSSTVNLLKSQQQDAAPRETARYRQEPMYNNKDTKVVNEKKISEVKSRFVL